MPEKKDLDTIKEQSSSQENGGLTSNLSRNLDQENSQSVSLRCGDSHSPSDKSHLIKSSQEKKSPYDQQENFGQQSPIKGMSSDHQEDYSYRDNSLPLKLNQGSPLKDSPLKPYASSPDVHEEKL